LVRLAGAPEDFPKRYLWTPKPLRWHKMTVLHPDENFHCFHACLGMRCRWRCPSPCGRAYHCVKWEARVGLWWTRQLGRKVGRGKEIVLRRTALAWHSRTRASGGGEWEWMIDDSMGIHMPRPLWQQDGIEGSS